LKHRFDALLIIDRSSLCQRRALEEIDKLIATDLPGCLVSNFHTWKLTFLGPVHPAV
jgi:hypothetical protein